MITRREFLKAAGLAAYWPYTNARGATSGVLVNDVHSQLTATRVERIVAADTLDSLRGAIKSARREGRAVCIAGGRHAMGPQPFATGAVMVDTRKLDRVLDFIPARGLIEVEAGIQWPELLSYIKSAQQGIEQQWTFSQKQTGADRLTIGGCLAANVHGRGLTLPPFVGDVESFRLVNPRGELVDCSRSERSDLFGLAIGGYGLFGPIYSVTLRLVPRRKVQRVVEVRELDGLMEAFAARMRDGFAYGDFQYSIDRDSDDFLRRGVFSCYKHVDSSTALPAGQRELSASNWSNLLYLAHTDKAQAFRQYAAYYLSTNGQVYWSDEQQMSIYPDDYHAALDSRTNSKHKATELITEIYVERDKLLPFMQDAREDFRRNGVDVIYGTVRLIEQDRETFLAWARKSFVCVIFNLHVVHTAQGRQQAVGAFRRLIDLGIKYGGSYYLTYHKYATRRQLEACYPQMPEFLRLKRKYDSGEVFQSDWYRHYKSMFSMR